MPEKMITQKKYKLPLSLIIYMACLLLLRFYLVLTTNRIFERPRLTAHSKIVEIFNVLTFLDIIALIIFGILIISIIMLQFKKRYLTNFLSYVLVNNFRTVIFLIYISFFAVAPLFSPGIPARGDGFGHLFKSWIVSNSVLNREFTLWTNYFWGGDTFLRFLGPLFYYLVGLINLFFHNVVFSFKFLLALFHIGSGLTMFLLLYTIKRDRLLSLIGSLAYVFTYWHYFWIVEMGRVRLSFFFMVMPLLYYLIEQFIATRHYYKIIILSILLASLILVQPAYYSIFTAYLLAIYILLRCLTLTDVQFRAKVSLFNKLILSFFLAFILSAWYVIPMYVENTVVFNRILFSNNFALPSPAIKSLFFWTPDPMPNNYGSYLGLSILILSFLGLYFVFRSQERRGIIFGLLYLFSFFLIFGQRFVFYKFIPFVFSFPSSGYSLVFLVFFLSILTSFGSEYIIYNFNAHSLKISEIIIISLILFDLAPLTFQDNYNDKLFSLERENAYRWLLNNADKNSRIVDLEDVNGETSSEKLVFATGLPMLNGPQRLHLPESNYFITKLIKELSLEFKNGQKAISDYLKKAYTLQMSNILFIELIWPLKKFLIKILVSGTKYL
jgi:hypothetical protein